ncbi:hypothetical protein R6Q59_005342 [Mikania micrantha]
MNCRRYVQVFRMIDTDGDGRITRSELEALLHRIGVLSAPRLVRCRATVSLEVPDRDGRIGGGGVACWFVLFPIVVACGWPTSALVASRVA